MLRRVLIYGGVLAIVTVGLNWLEYQVWTRRYSGEIYIALIASAFLGLGVWAGAQLFRGRPHTGPFEHNAAAQASLGITERELQVLRLLAAGRSNKEIALALEVSPNTIKTHLARLFEKLEVSRRTEAILRARELGLLP